MKLSSFLKNNINLLERSNMFATNDKINLIKRFLKIKKNWNGQCGIKSNQTNFQTNFS